MDKNTKLKVIMKIEPVDGEAGLRFEEEVTMEELARICRKDWKKGGGCPVGNVLSCPFYYKPYVERHKGERPIACDNVTTEDWVELYSIINEK